MASRRVQRQYALVLSLILHGILVAALTLSIPLSSHRQLAGPAIVPIETFTVDATAVAEEIERLNAEEEAERQRELEAERQREREAQERLRQEQEELARIEREQEEARQEAERERVRLQQEAEAEQLRLAELARQREEQERLEQERREEEERLAREEAERLAREEAERIAREEEERLAREAEERARQERIAAIEAEVAASIEAERTARAARDAGLRDQWARAIGNRVELYWNRPPNAGVGLECVLEVTQLPNGDVINVVVDDCNTDDVNIIRSIESAVLNASPLPQRPAGVEFERIVRITFSPTE